jgi:hypothetical protein
MVRIQIIRKVASISFGGSSILFYRLSSSKIESGYQDEDNTETGGYRRQVIDRLLARIHSFPCDTNVSITTLDLET